MNLKTTYILFGLLLAVLLVFAATQFSGCQNGGTDKEGYLFGDLVDKKKGRAETKDIDTVRIERPAANQTIVFVREKGGWQMTEPHHLRTDNGAVTRVVEDVANARSEPGSPSGSLGQYGLSEPRVIVTLKQGDKEWKLNVGDDTGKSGVAYVTTGAKPKDPITVSRSSLGSVLDEKLNDFREKTLLTANASSAAAVKLVDAKGATLALEKSSEGRWRFQQPAYGPANEGDSFSAAPSDKIGGVRDLIDKAAGPTGLHVEVNDDFVAEGVSNADLAAKYGLDKDKPETLRIEVKTKGDEEKTQVLLIGKKEEKKDEKKKDEKKDDKKPEVKSEYYFVRLDGENAVERVPAAKVKPLLDVTADADALRSRELVATGTGKIDLIDMKAGGNTLKLSQADGKWSVYHGTNRAADPDAVNALVKALTGDDPIARKKEPVVKSFVAKEDGLEFDKPAAVVSVWVDGLKKEEMKEEKKDEDKKDDKKDENKDDKKEPQPAGEKPAVKLTFGKHDRDKNVVYVKRESGGDTTIVTVADSLLEKVTDSYLAYLDHKLPAFSSSPFDAAKDVTKLTIKHGGRSSEVTQEKKDDKTSWKFVQQEGKPARGANESGIDDVLRELATLRAEKFVAEKPGEKELDQDFGLKNPDLKMTVTVKMGDKTEDWVYSFGKEQEYTTPLRDKQKGVYTKMDNSDLVFLVSKSAIDRLTGAELRDLTVFNFDVKQVKGAKVTVWSNDLGGPLTLDLERKGDKDWAKKDGPITPDGAKLDTFIGSISHLRGSKFAVPESGTDTGLDVNKKALKLEITTEGGVQELLVGNEDPKNKGFLFATSNKLPGDVFLVPSATFEKPKDSPAFYRK